jgi:hypothetical protein
LSGAVIDLDIKYNITGMSATKGQEAMVVNTEIMTQLVTEMQNGILNSTALMAKFNITAAAVTSVLKAKAVVAISQTPGLSKPSNWYDAVVSYKHNATNHTIQKDLEHASVHVDKSEIFGFPSNPSYPSKVWDTGAIFDFGVPLANASGEYRLYWHVDDHPQAAVSDPTNQLSAKVKFEWYTVGTFQIQGPVVPPSTVRRIAKRRLPKARDWRGAGVSNYMGKK